MLGETEQDRQLAIPKWIREMWKPELHRHLGGSMRISTLLELASNYGIKLPADTEEGIKDEVVFRRKVKKSNSAIERCLEEYLKCIKICESVLVHPDAFRRVAYEVIVDAVRNEHANPIELRFGPTNYVTQKMGLNDIIEAVLDGMKAADAEMTAEAKRDIHTGLIVCGIRGPNKQAVSEAAWLAVNHMDDGVVGFDLAGIEQGHSPKHYVEYIKCVIDNFLPRTLHAGEDETVRGIAEALNYMHAARIGHGLSLLESVKLREYVQKTRVGIEICLSSNIDTGKIPSVAVHPAKKYYFKHKLRIIPCTDNPTISNTDLNREYALFNQVLGFEMQDIFHLVRNGLKASFLDYNLTVATLSEFDRQEAPYLKGLASSEQ